MIQIPEMAMSLYMWLKNWMFDNSTNGTKSNNRQRRYPSKQPKAVLTINEHNINSQSHDDIIRISQEESTSMNERMDNIESKLSSVVLEMEKIANSITSFQNSN